MMLNYTVHTVDSDAPWIIFVHGAGGSIGTWRYQIDTFKERFNLLTLDLRDHGKSKNIQPDYPTYNFKIICNDILSVIDHLDIKKAHFISLSLGSVMVQRIALLRPLLVDKIVMAGGIFGASTKMKFFVHTAKFFDLFLPYDLIYRIFSWVVLPRKNHQFSRKMYQKQAKKLTGKEYMKWVGLYSDFFKVLHECFNSQLKNKCLIVMGAQDHIFLEPARNYAQKHQKASIKVLDKCGHICNIEQWEAFNKAAYSFLTAQINKTQIAITEKKAVKQ